MSSHTFSGPKPSRGQSPRISSHRRGVSAAGAAASRVVGVLSRTPGLRKERPFTDPVRAGSVHEDTPQAKPWRRLGRTRREKGAYVAAALAAFDTALVDAKRKAALARAVRRRRIDLLAQSGRSADHPLITGDRPDAQPGHNRRQASLVLQDGDRRVLAYLLDTHHHATGECYPRLQSIADAIARSREAVVDSLRRLKRYGFVRWIRRTKTKIGSVGLAGPQLEQTSSAYYFSWETSLTGRASMVFRQILHRCLKRIPPPPPKPKASIDDIADPALAEALSGLNASVGARERGSGEGSSASGECPRYPGKE